ncbi:GPN-loop GTPase 1-like [Pseudopipra pipra]|uniref:GPN-loop GTPase 1-like n=1 Tax=Pseudopipra pipra TaxID=415032 RepID=UPI003138E1D7
MKLMEKRQNASGDVILDPPGQTEVFTWSASGAIVPEALAPSFPSIAVDVPDTSGRTNPVAFMSDVLCACSILSKTKLPFLVGMDWPGFGSLARRKTKVTSSNRGRLKQAVPERTGVSGE